MAIASIDACDRWHREYCRLYWELNDLQLIHTCGDGTPIWETDEYRKTEARMNWLSDKLGYMPAP